MTDKRPVSRDDLRRILYLLEALDAKVSGEEPAPLWETLRDVHESRDSLDVPVHEYAVGDRFVAEELLAARVCLEGLLLHDGLVPSLALTPVQRPCLTPGCPETADLSYCLVCEIERGGAA